MASARDLAQQAVDNVWLTLAQRLAALVIVPILLAAGVSYMALRDRVTVAEAELSAQQRRIMVLEASDLTDRVTLTQLREQGAGGLRLYERINDLASSVDRLNNRIDTLMSPLRRGVP